MGPPGPPLRRRRSRRREVIWLVAAVVGACFAGWLWWYVGIVEPADPTMFHVEHDGQTFVCVETPDNLWCE